MDNDSDLAIEIKDIQVQCKSAYSCMTIDARVELLLPTATPYTSNASSMKCFDDSHRVIVKPREVGRVIGVLRIFPRSDTRGETAATSSRIIDGRISIITNSHVMEPSPYQDFRFFRGGGGEDSIITYNSLTSSTHFEVNETTAG